MESYHPIALLNCVGKLMEKIVFDRTDCDQNNRYLYPPYMPGFRKVHSSVNILVRRVTGRVGLYYRNKI